MAPRTRLSRRPRGVKADVVVEAAGNAPAFEAALAATSPGGRTVTVGLPNAAARASVSPFRLVAEARTVIGSTRVIGAVPGHLGVRPVVAGGPAARRALVSARIGLDDVNRAMDGSPPAERCDN